MSDLLLVTVHAETCGKGSRVDSSIHSQQLSSRAKTLLGAYATKSTSAGHYRCIMIIPIVGSREIVYFDPEMAHDSIGYHKHSFANVCEVFTLQHFFLQCRRSEKSPGSSLINCIICTSYT